MGRNNEKQIIIMGKKKVKHELKYEFDLPELKAAWNQLMRENAESMALGLKSVLKDIGMESDPKIHLKDDLILVKKINTDKGEALVVEKGKLVSKAYRLIANNERYLMMAIHPNQGIEVWFRRTGGVDFHTQQAFTTIDNAVKGADGIEDPLVVAEKIKQKDIEAGILNKDGTPVKIKEAVEELPLTKAIPKV